MGWATLEALARILAPADFARPQAATRLIETLAGAGYITPSEADTVRKLTPLRNRLTHGDLGAQVMRGDMDALLSILLELRQQAVEFK